MLNKIEQYNIENITLSGREKGKEIRENILSRLESEPLNVVMPISFEGIEFMDFSFTDEMVCKLVRRIISGELGERFIILKNLNDSLRESINAALNAREFPCVYLNNKDEVKVLGKLSPPLRETYDYALKQGKITTRSVHDRFGTDKEISASSNRLTRLEKLRLIYKSKEEVVNGGGRQFVYEPLR